jgi:ACS family tartrate transporter-like MFS transporter
MNRERAERAHHQHGSELRGLLSGRVWLLSIAYFLNAVVTYGVYLWLPRILRDASGYTGFTLSAITALPFVAALVAMILVGRHSDRTGERKWHVVSCALTAAAGLVLAAGFQASVPLLVLSFTLSQIGQRSVMSVFWAIPPIFLGGTAAAAGIAMINAIGNLGGAVGPTVMGWLRESTGTYTGGLLVLVAALVCEAILVASLRLPRAVAPAVAVSPVRDGEAAIRGDRKLDPVRR